MSQQSDIIDNFHRDGFIILRQLAQPEEVAAMKRCVEHALHPLQGPAEYESDLGYPGAPENKAAQGGLTPRRLLYAYSRDTCFKAWPKDQRIKQILESIFQSEVMLSQSHHNCIMTKSPNYSSETHWHQDIRYWSFDRPDLVSVWLALETEKRENGCLMCIPGSHRLELDRGRLDRFLFLRPELEENQSLIQKAITIELEPGDTLFFHSKLFHAAGKNQTQQKKWSLVYTYHQADNHAIPGTKSAGYPSIPI
jgi:phytanoyl-CoA hydroxylase